MKIDDLIETIRKRSREEWCEYAHDRWINSRIWVQEHGEKAALGALVLGVVLVIATKFVLSLLILAVILAATVYFLADPVSAKSAAPVEAAKQPDERDSGEEKKE